MDDIDYGPAIETVGLLLRNIGDQRPERAIDIAFFSEIMDGSRLHATQAALIGRYAPHPIYSGLWVRGFDRLKTRPLPLNPARFGDMVTDVLDVVAPI